MSAQVDSNCTTRDRQFVRPHGFDSEVCVTRRSPRIFLLKNEKNLRNGRYRDPTDLRPCTTFTPTTRITFSCSVRCGMTRVENKKVEKCDYGLIINRLIYIS
jgi:hypothetical protein